MQHTAFKQAERLLKRSLKGKVSITRALVIGFLMTGLVSTGGVAEASMAIDIEHVINYKANSDNSQSVHLDHGYLDFTNGHLTTTEVGPNGVVKVNVVEGKIDITNGTATASQPGVATASDVADAINNTNTVLTGKIDANTAKISANTDNITKNANNIAANTAKIADNTIKINDNATAIAHNATDIATNKADIATNTADIAANKTAIANNTMAITNLQRESQRIGAQSAAMAALKPIQYDPLEPTQIMAGIGNYRGETAGALGIAHYTNENTMFHIGATIGNDNNMVNAGVTHKFGSSAEKADIPDRYKAGPISSMYVMQTEMSQLQKENTEQKEVITAQQHRLSAMETENAQQKQQLDAQQKSIDELKAAVAALLARG